MSFHASACPLEAYLDTLIHKISLAVDEACTNVMRHAYEPDEDGSVSITVEIDGNQFVVSVADTGIGFDPDSIKEPDLQDFLIRHKVGGFGLYLMKTLMDKVEFSIDPRVWNEVRMVKYLNQ